MIQVEIFYLSIGQDSVRLVLDELSGFPEEPSYFGGYDARGTVEVRCGNYYVRGSLCFSTGQVSEFLSELKSAYDVLAGQACFRSSEGNLEMTVTIDSRGHVAVAGSYQEEHLDKTRLIFELRADQTYLCELLTQLRRFAEQYGEGAGVGAGETLGAPCGGRYRFHRVWRSALICG